MRGILESLRGLRKAEVLVPLLAVALGLCQCVILIWRIDIFRDGYFWKYQTKSLYPFVLIVGISVVTAGVVSWVLRRPNRPWLRVLVLIGLGYAIQMNVAYLEGRGIDGMRDRIVRTGHSEFAEIAVDKVDRILDMVRHYDDNVVVGDYGGFAKSKPPGTLLFYELTDRLAIPFAPSDRDQLATLHTVAAYTWPLLTYSVLIPLFALTSLLLDSRAALLASSLYIVVPSVTLVTLHTDQTLFPLLFVTPLALGAYAMRERSIALSAVSGCCVYVALFHTYGLLPVLPMGLGVLAATHWCSSCAEVRAPRNWARTTVGVAGGIVLSHLVARLFLGFDLLAGWDRAMAYHQSLRRWDQATDLWHWAGVNSLEFSFWLGFPLTAVFLATVVMEIGSLRSKERTSLLPIALSVLAIVAGLLLFSKTKSEVARIWIFLMPVYCVVAGGALARLTRWRIAAAVVLVLQFVIVLLMKHAHDFF